MKTASFFLLHFFTIHFLFADTQLSQKYALKLDPVFSEYARMQFSACLQELSKLHAPLSFVVKTLQETFPVIAHIQAQMIANDAIKIFCKAALPLARAAQDVVVLASCDCVKKDFFIPEVTNDIITIEYKNKSAVVEQAYLTFALHNNHHVFLNYHITWHTPYHIEVVHPVDKTVFVADYQTILSQDVLNACDYVTKDLSSKKKKWLVDIRFSNQIVVYEGGRYEKSIRT